MVRVTNPALEFALLLTKLGEFLVRRGAKRAARSVIKDSIAAWAAISAAGKVAQVTEKHEWLLNTATSSRSVDVSCQTVDSLLALNQDAVVQEHFSVPHVIQQEDRKHRWLEPGSAAAAGERSLDISGVGLGKDSLINYRYAFSVLTTKQTSLIYPVYLSQAKLCRLNFRLISS